MAGQNLPIQPDSSGAISPGDHSPASPFPSKIAPYVVTTSANRHSLCLAVEGVHCAGCIRKIESGLLKISGVNHARLNFSTQRLNIDWTGEAALADLITATIESLGYKATPFDPASLNRSSTEEARFLLLCLGVAGFAAGNIMLVSFALWTTDTATMGIAVRDFLHWVSALIALPSIAFSGRPFFYSALKALRNGRTNMDVPISVGLILTTGMSLFELATHGEHAYFDSAVMLMFFLLIGRYLDYIARASARRAADNLLSMMAGTATVIEDGHSRNILIREIRKGMRISVAMGEHVPADGIILSGRTEIDASLVTGESLPYAANPGDEILSGTLNLSAPIQIQTLRTPEESQLGGMVRLMEKAEQSQAKYVRIADRVARLYTPVVHLLALSAFLGWVLIAHLAWQKALLIAATVLIITCPCALALAVPIVQVLAVGKLMRRGIMVRSGDIFERLDTVDTVIFDKTGTLTLGKPQLVSLPDIDADDFKIAASMASQSRHILARALASAWHGEVLHLEVEEIPGSGLRCLIDGHEYRLGRRSWATNVVPFGENDTTEIAFARDMQTPIIFHFRDTLRPDAAEIVSWLKQQGMTLYLLSGDKPGIAEAIGRDLNFDVYRGGMTPEQKFSCLEDLHTRGHKIMMVGDGINDAPILAGADVSVSPASGIDIARNASGVVFTGDRLAAIRTLFRTGRFSQKLVRQNFAMTIFYNALAIPVAMAGYITPFIAAAAMSLSSLAVILNAFRIRRASP